MVTSISMDLSVNPLDNEGEMWKWLISKVTSKKDRINQNKSQYRKDLVKTHLQKSLQDLFHILPFSHKFKKDSIYETFNALTLYDMLYLLFLDVEQMSEQRTEKYDFRTVELARMSFHISALYLKNSPLWKDEINVKNDIERVASHFRILAKSALEQESYKIIKQKDEETMRDELESHTSDPQSESNIIENRRHELIEEKKPYYEEFVILNSLEKGALTNNKIKEAKSFRTQKEKTQRHLKRYSDNIDLVDEQRRKIDNKIQVREHEISELLSHKYDHLKTVFCPFDKLGPFKNIINNPHLPQDHPFSSLDLMFKPYYVYRYIDETI